MKFILNRFQSVIRYIVANEFKAVQEKIDSQFEDLKQVHQKLLFNQMKASDFNTKEAGFSVFSESDEDGLLLNLFAKIGFDSKTIVDIGGGSGLQGSNSANLILHHGFSGLIIEGKEENVEALKLAYASKQKTKHSPPKIISAFVTVENINKHIEENGITGSVDLLSIDIDSIDYWIWDAITIIDPRVVIVEVQCILDENESKSVPPEFKETVFETVDNKRYGIYNSASLLAFNRLANRKGYRLVATNQLGFNAIFIKNELAISSVPTISVKEGLDKDFVKWAQKVFGSKTKELLWTEV